MKLISTGGGFRARRSNKRTKPSPARSVALQPVVNAIVEALESRQMLTVSVWNNLSGTGTSIPWNTSANWSPSNSFPHTSSDSANLNVNILSNQGLMLGVSTTLNALTLGDSSLSNGTGQSQTINAGSTLTFDNGSSAATLTMAANAVGAVTIAAPISLSSNLVITNNSSETLTISGNLTLHSNSLTVTGSGPVVLSGAVVGVSTGSTLLKTGTGTLTLSGTADNSYLMLDAEAGTVMLAKSSTSGVHAVGGITNIASGSTVRLAGSGADQIFDRPTGSATGANLGGGTLDLAGTNEGFDQLTGTGTVTNSVAGSTSTLTIGTFNGSSNFSGTIQDGGTAVALVKSGSGTLTLSGANSYSGGTAVSAGTLQVGSGSTDNVSTAGTGPIVDNAALVFATQATLPTVASPISGTGKVITSGSGTVVLSGSNTYSGGTTLSAGTLSISALSDTTTSNLGTSGTLTFAGGGLLYTGPSTSTARAIALAANNPITVQSASATLTLSQALAGGAAGVTLLKQGSGTLTLSGTADNAYLALDAEAGSVILAKASTSSVHAVVGITNIAAGATVRLAGTGGDQIYDRPNGTGIGATLGGGTLDLAGFSEGFDQLTGTGTVTNSLSRLRFHADHRNVQRLECILRHDSKRPRRRRAGQDWFWYGYSIRVKHLRWYNHRLLRHASRRRIAGRIGECIGQLPRNARRLRIDRRTDVRDFRRRHYPRRRIARDARHRQPRPRRRVQFQRCGECDHVRQLRPDQRHRHRQSRSAHHLNLSGTRTNHDGDQITLINNDGSDAVTGTFNNLPQGSKVTVNGVNYVLSYTGGTGNDVTLTDSTPPHAASDNYSASQNVTLTQNAAHGVLSNDSGYNGGTLSVYSVDGSTSEVNTSLNTGHGTLTLHADGSFTYVPAHDFVGVDDATFYVASDGIELSNQSTVQFVVAPGALSATGGAWDHRQRRRQHRQCHCRPLHRLGGRNAQRIFGQRELG